MSLSATGANVLRYSALAFGVFYGFTHQRKITATQKVEAAKREYEHKQSLIAKAKEEYARMKNPALGAAGDGVIRDPMDPKFDMESYFQAVIKENP